MPGLNSLVISVIMHCSTLPSIASCAAVILPNSPARILSRRIACVIGCLLSKPKPRSQFIANGVEGSRFVETRPYAALCLQRQEKRFVRNGGTIGDELAWLLGRSGTRQTTFTPGRSISIKIPLWQRTYSLNTDDELRPIVVN